MTDRTETDEILDGYLTADFDPLQAFAFDDDTDADDEAPSVLAEGPFNMPNPEAAPQFQRDLVAFDNGETAEERIDALFAQMPTFHKMLFTIMGTCASPLPTADLEEAIAEMKRLNESIKDEKISRQIDRLEEISGKIFDCVKASPEKLPQIRKFMNYYLPTTLKLLNAYDRMGSQGVSGENISGTMERVENMMGTIVTAFERQLDGLFGDQALDISTDITVLENMMAREGLSDDPIHRTQSEQTDSDDKSSGGIQLEL